MVDTSFLMRSESSFRVVFAASPTSVDVDGKSRASLCKRNDDGIEAENKSDVNRHLNLYIL